MTDKELINELMLALGSANWVLSNRHNKDYPEWEMYAQNADTDIQQAFSLAHGKGYFGKKKEGCAQGEFALYHKGLNFASVCSSLPQPHVEAKMAREMIMSFSKKAFRSGVANPCPCNRKPDTHTHYLFEA